MRIIGHGIDLVEIGRFSPLIEKQRFLTRCFTESELRYCGGHADKLAARFAAKEAVLKALRIGITNGISLCNIEVVFNPDGAPNVRLTGSVLERASDLGVTEWQISFTHGLSFAVASAIACGR